MKIKLGTLKKLLIEGPVDLANNPDLFPRAWEEWNMLCSHHGSSPDHSYFFEEGGVLYGDGAQEYTTFRWNPDAEMWEDVDQAD